MKEVPTFDSSCPLGPYVLTKDGSGGQDVWVLHSVVIPGYVYRYQWVKKEKLA